MRKIDYRLELFVDEMVIRSEFQEFEIKLHTQGPNHPHAHITYPKKDIIDMVVVLTNPETGNVRTFRGVHVPFELYTGEGFMICKPESPHWDIQGWGVIVYAPFNS